MKRVMIIGSGGAGKSTLSRQLGEVTGLPVVHLDAVHWKPNWVEPSKQEWHDTVKRLVQNESWIIDGNYGDTIDIRFDAADTIIFMDFPRLLCVQRVFIRAWKYRGRTRPDMGPLCPEKIDWPFLKWIWTYPERRRPGVLETLKRHETNKSVIILRSQTDIVKFLDPLRAKEHEHVVRHRRRF